MIIGVVFKEGKEIDRGIKTAGKQWVEAYPEQNISICDECSYSHIENDRTYKHGDNVYFQELQNNGDGWEVVYDSNERVDKTKYYPLPSWFATASPIPNYTHRMNEDGEIEDEFKGYIK